MKPIPSGGLLLIACTLMPLARAQDIRLDENVVWAASAASSLVPESIGLDLISAAVGDDGSLAVPLRRLRFNLGESAVELLQLRVYRFESADAIRDFGNVLTYYDAATDTIVVDSALVIDPDGEVHTIDPGTVQILSSDTLSVFGDQKILVIPLPGLQVGATAIVAERTVTDRDRDFGPWGVVVRQQYGVPLERLEISVAWSSPELRPIWHSGLESLTCTEPDAASLECAAVDIPPYPTDEEAFYDDIVPQFVMAEQGGWSEVRDWYKSLFESSLSADATVRAAAERITAGADTEVEKLRAIHRFVATEIRYVGLEQGDSAFVPHPTSTTLARRYGDCKDKAALLIDLLQHVDIEMQPVLVATTRRVPEKLVVPTHSYFDHLIVCGTLSNGQSYCLDSTDPYTGIESLSAWIQGAVSLPVTDDGVLARLPEDTHAWVIRENLDLSLGAAGELVELGSVEYAGGYGSSLRGSLAGLTSSELQEWAVEDYHAAVSPAVDPEFEIAGIEDIDSGLTVSWDVTYENLLQPTGNLVYTEAMPWLNQALDGASTQNDTFDYRFVGLDFDSRVTVHVDDIWTVESTGPDIDMQSRFGVFRRSYSSLGQTVEIRTEFSAPAAVIGVDEVPAFNRFLEIVMDEGFLHVRGPAAATN